MAREFVTTIFDRQNGEEAQRFRTLETLEDIRELLFLMLHAQVAFPDTAGNLEPVKRRLERFVERRTAEVGDD